MSPTERLDRFYKNLWLIEIACLHYVHEMVDAELVNSVEPRLYKRPAYGKYSQIKKIR